MQVDAPMGIVKAMDDGEAESDDDNNDKNLETQWVDLIDSGNHGWLWT